MARCPSFISPYRIGDPRNTVLWRNDLVLVELQAQLASLIGVLDGMYVKAVIDRSRREEKGEVNDVGTLADDR